MDAGIVKLVNLLLAKALLAIVFNFEFDSKFIVVIWLLLKALFPIVSMDDGSVKLVNSLCWSASFPIVAMVFGRVMLLISRPYNDSVPSSVIPSSIITFSIPAPLKRNKPLESSDWFIGVVNLCDTLPSSIINFLMWVPPKIRPLSLLILVLLNTSAFIINSSSSFPDSNDSNVNTFAVFKFNLFKFES